MKTPYIYNLPVRLSKNTGPVRALLDTLYIEMIRYNLKHGIKDCTRKSVSKLYNSMPKWKRLNWYEIYRIKQEIAKLKAV